MILYFVLFSAFVALAHGYFLVRKVMSKDPGTPAMVEVAKAIQEGARAYLTRQMRVLVLLFTGSYCCNLLRLSGYLRQSDGMIDYRRVLGISLPTRGLIAPALTGIVGMSTAVRANDANRQTRRENRLKKRSKSFQAGTVTGMFTIGMGLLGATIIFMIFKEHAMDVLVGFGFWRQPVALFMRVGGGIFTKAADVGADLVGKIETKYSRR
jgi:K(+)-stimulated pyrophosphate-energized sodium pump